jgi:hypothetical protein
LQAHEAPVGRAGTSESGLLLGAPTGPCALIWL